MLDSKVKISVVIITKNEASKIVDCIFSCLEISDDVVVVDSESSDNTVEIASGMGARIFVEQWKGYGNAKNFGAQKAVHSWILSIDADERLDKEMITTLRNIDLNKEFLYGFRRLNHIGDVPILHGEWNPDIKFRLYHRDHAMWSLDAVHEELVGSPWQKKVVMPGYILHFSYETTKEMTEKLYHYARLAADDMLANGESSGFFSWLKPTFRFIRAYIIKGGFKDGQLGYKIAKANADAIKTKYRYVKEALRKSKA